MKKVFFYLLVLFLGVVLVILPKPSKVEAQANPLSKVKHVFIILMENHDWSAITSSSAPYMIKTLLPIGAHAENYHNIPTSLGSLHPSEPNYIFLEGGTNHFSDITFTTDNNASSSNSTSSTQHLATQLKNAGLTWKSYQEDTPGGCPISRSGDYASKHNPFVFFQDVSGNPPSSSNSYCANNHSDLTTTILQNDLDNGNVANYNFLTPNLCNDMHDCSVSVGDTWLSKFIPVILNSNLYKQDGAIFITWDEGGSGNKPIGMIALSPFIKPGYSDNVEYSHASMVKTVEDIFNLRPYIGHAADTSVSNLSSFFLNGTTQTTQPTPTTTTTPSSNPTPSGLQGDANGDNKVDESDYLIWLANLGKSTSNGTSTGDFDKSGKIDGIDYIIWLLNHGKTAPIKTPISTPKPSNTPTATPTSSPTAKPTVTASPTLAPTPTGNTGLLPAVNDTDPRINCSKYPEKRIFLETQEWWMDSNSVNTTSQIPLKGIGGHTHTATCFPQDQLITGGTMQFDVRLMLHKGEVGGVHWLDVGVGPGGSSIARVNFSTPIVCPGGSDPKVNCEYWIPITVDTNKIPSGYQELRFRFDVEQPNDERQFASTGWEAYYRTMSGAYRNPPWVEARGWYTNAQYANARFLSPIPYTPVSGIWTFKTAMVPGSGGITVTHHGVHVDAHFNLDDFGWTIMEGSGQYTGNVSIDTRKLQNGRHYLAIKTDQKASNGGTNTGILQFPFYVQN